MNIKVIIKTDEYKSVYELVSGTIKKIGLQMSSADFLTQYTKR